MPAVPAAQAHCCLVARLPMCSAAQEFALGWWRQTHEAALLCTDILREIHCRDLKVLQWLTKWELGWQNDPVMLLRLGRRRGVGVLLQCVSELWEFVTERSRCERFRSWLSDVLADEECCFIPFPSMFSSKSNLPQLCIFLSYLRLLMACSFVSACSCCRHEEEELVFALLVIGDPVALITAQGRNAPVLGIMSSDWRKMGRECLQRTWSWEWSLGLLST